MLGALREKVEPCPVWCCCDDGRGVGTSAGFCLPLGVFIPDSLWLGLVLMGLEPANEVLEGGVLARALAGLLTTWLQGSGFLCMGGGAGVDALPAV